MPGVSRTSLRPPYLIAGLDSEAGVPQALAALAAGGIRVFEASPDHFDLYEYYRERVAQA